MRLRREKHLVTLRYNCCGHTVREVKSCQVRGGREWHLICTSGPRTTFAISQILCWTLENWLPGKSLNFCAKPVLSSDPFLGLDEENGSGDLKLDLSSETCRLRGRKIAEMNETDPFLHKTFEFFEIGSLGKILELDKVSILFWKFQIFVIKIQGDYFEKIRFD